MTRAATCTHATSSSWAASSNWVLDHAKTTGSIWLLLAVIALTAGAAGAERRQIR